MAAQLQIPVNTDLPQSRGIHAAVAFVLGATRVGLLESSLVPTSSASFTAATANLPVVQFTMDETTELQGTPVPLDGIALWVFLFVVVAAVPPLVLVWRRNAWQIQLRWALSLFAITGPLWLLLGPKNLDQAIPEAIALAPFYVIPMLFVLALSVYWSSRLISGHKAQAAKSVS